MADLMEILRGRRSIRKYQQREVPKELLTQVLESIRWAPSWANTQCWEVIVVADSAMKARLQEALPQGNPARKSLVTAPIILVICAKRESSGYYKGKATTKLGDWFMFDLGIATQNLCLTAHALGLGTVITGLFDHNKARGALGVPEGYEVVAMTPLGYPEKGAAAPKRREVSEFVHYEQF